MEGIELAEMAAWDVAELQVQAVKLATAAGVGVLLVLAAYILGRIASSAATAALHRAATSRSGTLTPIVRKGIMAAAMAVGVTVALDNVGVPVATIIAGAGILGLAVGFGAQSLVKDLISGFFLLLEDVLRVGDLAEVGGHTGTIEEVGLRMTKLRELSGQLWYIPNGEITTVGNYNREWTRAVVEVGLAYEQDMGRGLAVLQAVGDQYAKDHPGMVLEAPEAQGAIGLNDSAVGIRLLVKVLPNELWPVERDLRRLLKARFDEEGIEIPFPRQVVYFRQEEGSPVTVAMTEPDQRSSAGAR
jgi:moderate conductance mechanosensitive channel